MKGVKEMLLDGGYSGSGKYQDLILEHHKDSVELVIVDSGVVNSAYKRIKEGRETTEYAFGNMGAKEVWEYIESCLKKCTKKNLTPIMVNSGVAQLHEFTWKDTELSIILKDKEILEFNSKDTAKNIDLKEATRFKLPAGLEYVKLSKQADFKKMVDEEEVVVRSVAEIALTKEDVTWLKNKKYYIVNDDETAERIFSYLENYSGPIAYDTETTGLKINMFSKVNSKEQKILEEYNKNNPENKIRADRLVGIIFSIEPNVSYYFPVFNRKFKNLYEDKSSEVRKRVIENNRKQLRESDPYCISDIGRIYRDTADDDLTCDVILMERVRRILERCHIVAHNGTFEWKVSWCYDIDINLKDDTILLHQVMYKFRSTTENRGEPSNLKYLAKTELNMDQWELGDFFPDYKESTTGKVRANAKSKSKKTDSNIDFSYMTYDGAKIYAPADGDATIQLLYKYKKDLLENHAEQRYIYEVEVYVACAIGYMEFYGIRIDESKILNVRLETGAKISLIESQIRQLVNYAKERELEAYKELKEAYNNAINSKDSKEHDRLTEIMVKKQESLMAAIKEDEEHELNLASPAQVAELFYDIVGIPMNGDKRSVSKSALKPLAKMRDEEGRILYPVVGLYQEYKKQDTLMTKFFDNLPYFMFPGGFIFPSFGQISTATGRMSCKNPNAQQFPKAITNIIVPRDGFCMMDADYSQIEYRVLVAMAQEEKLAKMMADPDSDYHTLMASLMFSVDYSAVTPELRGSAKSFNFGIPYGMGFKSLALLLSGNSSPEAVRDAKEKYELYFKDQPNVRKFFERVKEMALVNKYTRTFWNRYRYYSFEAKDGDKRKAEAKKASALRQAGNAVIQGSAADIFKISIARNFMYIRKNHLLGKLLIINMIHDEQLFEVDVSQLNILKVIADIGHNMQFKVKGFPPLYIGAGVGEAWAKAKGKMAEIHPHLMDEFMREAEHMGLYIKQPMNPKDVLKYFKDRVLEFRKNKVIEYLTNSENEGKILHPAIGSLINLQFTYGIEQGDMTDDEHLIACLAEFIRQNNLDVDINKFPVKAVKEDVEEEEGYEDDEDENLDEDGYYEDSDFILVDESDKVYGTSIQEMISKFGLVVSLDKHICGIDIRTISYKKLDKLADYLNEKACSPDDEDRLELVYLDETNIIKHSGIFVKGIDAQSLCANLNIAVSMYR